LTFEAKKGKKGDPKKNGENEKQGGGRVKTGDDSEPDLDVSSKRLTPKQYFDNVLTWKDYLGQGISAFANMAHIQKVGISYLMTCCSYSLRVRVQGR
jgi:hypothetical protein